MKFPSFFCKPEVYYRVHKRQKFVPILSYMNPVHNLAFNFVKIHSNIILPFTPRFPSDLLPSGFPTKIEGV
jgi:hypothetical protein